MLPSQPRASFQVQPTAAASVSLGLGSKVQRGVVACGCLEGRNRVTLGGRVWATGRNRQLRVQLQKGDRGRGRGARERSSKDPEADLEGPTDLQTHSTRETGARGGESKDWTNGGEENEERHRVNQRWSQKSQVTEAEANAQRKKSAGTQSGTRESLGMGRVSMWLLWTTLLLVLPLGGLGPPLCPREPFYFLIAITKMLENKNDGSLYTRDNLLVCPAETLCCFRLDLSVIGFEEGPSVGISVFRLQRLLDALGSRLWVTGQGPCPPCEGHPQRPVPLFLAKLLELLQGTCAQELPSA